MKRLAALLSCLFLSACVVAPPPQGSALAVWHPSPNHEPRRANYVILHHTSNNSAARALGTLTHPLSGVSSHYLVGRDGRVWQLVDERQRAWHAGLSRWKNQTDMNSASIGIELDNNGNEAFSEAQIVALIALLEDIRARLGIPRANVLGHADIAPTRKSDPSAFFPWKRLAAAGFGLWCDPPFAAPPETFTPLWGLAQLGYDIRTPEAAIAAFKRHFTPEDPSPGMNAAATAHLYCLTRKSMEAH
ncbi:MAG: N-acetylmuramoyl-L-alanine amidase [Zoogloeaceae bacterium]|jgi:N-acetylmuramoyl-L-alanine amidase|nr:N-acetylmuramoyl-L-alanine amidase [Zoogloeaceae bacterium]